MFVWLVGWVWIKVTYRLLFRRVEEFGPCKNANNSAMLTTVVEVWVVGLAGLAGLAGSAGLAG